MGCVSYRASFHLLCVPRHMRFTAVAERKACAKNSNTTRIVIHKGSTFYSCCCCWHHRCASVYSNVDFIVQPNSFPRFAPNHSLCIGGTSNELAPAERRMRAKRMYSKVRSVQVKEKKTKRENKPNTLYRRAEEFGTFEPSSPITAGFTIRGPGDVVGFVDLL